MADNVTITPGTGASVATDEIGGIHYQRVKVALGADGSAADAASGAGTVSDAVQRITLASDDPAVAALADLLAQLRPIAETDLSEVRIDVSSSGDTAIVGAEAGETTRVHRLILIAAEAVTVQIKDGSTVLLETPLVANQGFILGFEERPWFTTTANTALNINLSAAVSVQGRLYYRRGDDA